MKLVLKLFISVIFLAAVLLLTVPFFLDWNQYKTNIESRVNEITGLSLEIKGDINAQVLPYPGVSANNVILRNPDLSGPEGEIISLKRFDITLAYKPLLTGKIVFNALQLEKPEISLIQKNSGIWTWQTDELAALLSKKAEDVSKKKSKQGAGFPVQFNEIIIKDGHIKYVTPTSQQGLENVDMTVESASPAGPFNIGGTLEYQEETLSVSLKTEKLVQGSESLSLQAEIFAPRYDLKASFAGVTDFSKVPDMQGELGIEILKVSELLNLSTTSKQKKKLGPLKVKGLLSTSPQQLAMENIQIIHRGEVTGNGKVLLDLSDKKSSRHHLGVDLQLVDSRFLDPLMSAFAPQGEADNNKSKNIRSYIIKALSNVPQSILLPQKITSDINVSSSSIATEQISVSGFNAKINKSAEDIELKLNIPSLTSRKPFYSLSDLKVTSNIKFDPIKDTSDAFLVAHKNPVMTLDWEGDANLEKALEEPSGFENVINKTLFQKYYDRFSNECNLVIQHKKLSFDECRLKFPGRSIAGSGSYEVTREASEKALKSKAILNLNFSNFSTLPFAKKPENSVSKVSFDTNELIKTFSGYLSAYLPADNANVAIKASELEVDDGVTIGRLMTSTFLTPSEVQIESFEVNDYLEASGRMSGTADFDDSLKSLKLDLNASVPNIQKIVKYYNLTMPNKSSFEGKVDVSLQAAGQLDKLNTVLNIDALDTSLKAKGNVNKPLDDLGLSAFEVQLSSSDLLPALSVIKGNMFDSYDLKGKTDLFAVINSAQNVHNIRDIQGTLFGTSLKGEGGVDLAGNVPSFKASLQTGTVNLNKFLPAKAQGTGKSANKQSGARDSEGKDVRWSRNAINTDWMHKFDFKGEIVSEKIIFGKVMAENVAAKGSLQGGVLNIESADAKVFKGKGAFSGVVRTKKDPREPLSISASIDMKDIQAGQVLTSFETLPDKVMTGEVDYTAQFESLGLSPAALIYGLKGKGQVEGSGITIYGLDLDGLSRKLSDAQSVKGALSFLQGSLAGGKTIFNELNSQYVIKEGIVDIQSLNLTGDDTSIRGQGKIDLPLWRIDLNTILEVKEPADAPPFEARFEGPLDNPSKTFATSPLKSFIQGQLQRKLEGILKNKLNLEDRTQQQKTEEGENQGDATTDQGARGSQTKESPGEKVIRGILGDILK